MKSKCTSSPYRPALSELTDLLFVPTSILRLTHTNVQECKWVPIEKYRNSKLAQVMPYVGACFFETARVYGYYKLVEALVN